jgi:cyanophycin synthetase
MEIRLAGFRTRVRQNDTPLDDYVTLCVAANKPLTYRLLNECGLATAKYVVFHLEQISKAVTFMHTYGKDCVVKPAAGWGGVGVTTGVRTIPQLAKASAGARVFGDRILIQEQLFGENYRLVYLDGKLLDAVVRRYPSVQTNGTSSIATLLKQENHHRLEFGSDRSQSLLTADLDVKTTLARQGLTLSSVPPAGMTVQLKTVINDNSATENATATHILCEAIVAAGAAATEALGVRLAGVDIITPNPAVSLEKAGGAIIEVNTAPGQYWHYHKQSGEFPLADHVLAALLAEHPECGLDRVEINSLLIRSSTPEIVTKSLGELL